MKVKINVIEAVSAGRRKVDAVKEFVIAISKLATILKENGKKIKLWRLSTY